MATSSAPFAGWRMGVLCFAALLAPLPGGAQPSASSLGLVERIQLFNGCRPMLVGVEPMEADAAAIQLTPRMLSLAAESRLRAARLYGGALDPSAFGATRESFHDQVEAGKTPGMLIIVATVVGEAFGVRLDYMKAMEDEFGFPLAATTWSVSAVGTHGGDASYVQSFVSQAMDEFLAGYLRVNEDACE